MHVPLSVQLPQQLHALGPNDTNHIPGQPPIVATLKHPLKRRAEQVHNKHIIPPMRASVVHGRRAIALQSAEDLPLAARDAPGAVLELDGDLIVRPKVQRGVYVTKVARAQVLVLKDDVPAAPVADLSWHGVLRALVVGHGGHAARLDGGWRGVATFLAVSLYELHVASTVKETLPI